MSQLASSPTRPGDGPGKGPGKDPGNDEATTPGTGPERPAVRARSGRRPVPPLVFLLVLALGAAAVWIYVLQHDNGTTSSATCAAAVPSLAPSSVTVQVLNGTTKQGLATTVAKDLQARGFKVGPPDNDRTGRQVDGVGEIRHGARGKQAALFLGAYLPGATDYQDTRATGTVDLVIGPMYEKLASPDQVTAALNTPTC